MLVAPVSKLRQGKIGDTILLVHLCMTAICLQHNSLLAGSAFSRQDKEMRNDNQQQKQHNATTKETLTIVVGALRCYWRIAVSANLGSHLFSALLLQLLALNSSSLHDGKIGSGGHVLCHLFREFGSQVTGCRCRHHLSMLLPHPPLVIRRCLPAI